MAKAKGSAAIVENAKNFVSGFRTFSTGQKAVVIAVVAALLGGAVLFSQWASKPSYSPLFSNLSGTDASAITDKLSADGVKYQIADGGKSILVPADKVDAERLAMAGAGLPADTGSGYTLLDDSGVTTSEFMQQKKYQIALQSELGTTIESIDGVQKAIVNLAVPQKDVFLDEQKPTTASVLLKLKPGTTLSNDNVTAIVNLVAGGVEGMDPKNVSVVDDQGNTLSSDGTGSSAQNEKTTDYNASASSALQTYLEGIYGQGNVKATVKATLDFDDKTVQSKTYTQPTKIDPLAQTTSTEVYNGNGSGSAAATGVLGPDNIAVPSGTSTAGSGNGGYSKTSGSSNPAIDETNTVVKQAPGKVTKQTVSVVLNAGAKGAAGAADVNQVTQIATQAAGVDATRGDQITVVKTAFDNTASTAAAAELAKAEKADQQAQLISYGKTGALALLVLIMLIVILIAFRRRKVETVDVLDVDPLQLGDITAPADGLKEIAPAVEKPVALEAAPVDPALEAAAARRTEVVELVSRQPEEVAELLRGWLADRRS
ncbi:flagellar basal-body MS-ring/collar protein FliF [Kineococcus rhizosphaerae]|uniref:Flagellar M-ring protein n=1 Tax=Kineococcus rhizosphaerae TaxID=559628 RepID=A0A2T0RAN6_9ACTN|nr:flagellar basal-body MS-ring/collar protein FliF [Kineococcus rhizosphaerae]PRY18219.1 flagellar M-ring protein FliF [Kineococcus rhizosphaerae]